MKNILSLLLVAFAITGLNAQKVRHSVLQLQAGISSPLSRWDKDFDIFDASFFDLATISQESGPRLYSKPAYGLELSYLHKIEKSFTWKIGALTHKTNIDLTTGDSYSDSLKINLSDFGLCAFAVKNFHPGDGNVVTLQLGASAGYMTMNNGQIIDRSDTTDVLGLLSIVQTSKMQMELVSKVLVRAIAKAEWFSRLTDHWSVSAAFLFEMPLTSNSRFSFNSNIDTGFFPVNTTVNTSNFSMPYWTIQAGIARDIYKKQKQASVPQF